MIIAVTYDVNDGSIFQHFGKCPNFLICEIEDSKVVSAKIIDTDLGHGCGMRIPPLMNENVEAVICGNLGAGARNHIAEANMELYPGAIGDAKGAVEAFINGDLDYDKNTSCIHHPA